MEDTRYGIRIKVDASYETTVERTKLALQAEGFGVLTTIDVQQTLKRKIADRGFGGGDRRRDLCYVRERRRWFDACRLRWFGTCRLRLWRGGNVSGFGIACGFRISRGLHQRRGERLEFGRRREVELREHQAIGPADVLHLAALRGAVHGEQRNLGAVGRVQRQAVALARRVGWFTL